MEHLDVRTVTLGLSLRDCASENDRANKRTSSRKIHRLPTTGEKVDDRVTSWNSRCEQAPPHHARFR